MDLGLDRPQSRLCLVSQDPGFLFSRVRNRATSRGFDRIERGVWGPAEMDERAGRCDRCPADTAPAMHADMLAGAETAGEVGYEAIEGGGVRRNVRIGNREREKLHAELLRKLAFLVQVKHGGLGLAEERNEGVNAAIL